MDDAPTMWLARTSEAKTYHLEGPGSWALVTVNDRTGELDVETSWGWSWDAQWDMTRRRGTLTEFLGEDADCDYLASQLYPGGETADRDWDAMVREVKSEILKARRHRTVTVDEAARLWRFVHGPWFQYDWDDELEEDWKLLRRVVGWGDDDPKPVVTKATHPYEVLRYGILPAFKSALKESR